MTYVRIYFNICTWIQNNWWIEVATLSQRCFHRQKFQITIRRSRSPCGVSISSVGGEEMIRDASTKPRNFLSKGLAHDNKTTRNDARADFISTLIGRSTVTDLRKHCPRIRTCLRRSVVSSRHWPVNVQTSCAVHLPPPFLFLLPSPSCISHVSRKPPANPFTRSALKFRGSSQRVSAERKLSFPRATNFRWSST